MLVSIAIPTYKRLPFLKRAVDDVLNQTWKDWELIISDDEKGNGDTWDYLTSLAQSDSRIKVIKNNGDMHGQVYNVNNAMRHCRGEWIKPFFDDDRMLPNCIEELVLVATSDFAKSYGVVMVGCRAQCWRDGTYSHDDDDFCAHEVEIIPKEETLLAICLYDRWNGRTPTHMLMRGDVIRNGALMIEDSAYKHPIDVRWFAKILEHGAFAMTKKVLVCECQGEVASGTSELKKQEAFVTEENRRIRREIFLQICKLNGSKSSRFSSRRIDGLVCGIRGLYHFKLRQFCSAIKYMSISLLCPSCIALVLRWVKQTRYSTSGKYCATRRVWMR